MEVRTFDVRPRPKVHLPGDLIKDIDGQSLTDPTQAMQVFQSLGTAEQVTVTVERNGQPQTIILKTSQLDMDGEQTK